jgi:hypothetical protein
LIAKLRRRLAPDEFERQIASVSDVDASLAASGLLAQKRLTQKTEVRPQIHDGPDFRLLTKLGFQQPGDLSRIAQTAARKQPRELLHFAVLQRRHREGPYSPLTSLLSLANPDQPSESLATLRLTRRPGRRY